MTQFIPFLIKPILFKIKSTLFNYLDIMYLEDWMANLQLGVTEVTIILFTEIPYFGYKSNDCFLKKDEVIKRRSHSFYEVDPFPIEEKADLTPKSRKTTNNKFDGDVRSSIKNYYNKYNLVFDPEKYSYNRMNSGKLLRKRSMVLDLDSLPERKTQSSMYLIKKDIIYRYSIQEILQYYEDYHNQRTQRPKAFEKFIPPIMTYTSKLTLDQFREKKEKRERAATFFESKEYIKSKHRKKDMTYIQTILSDLLIITIKIMYIINLVIITIITSNSLFIILLEEEQDLIT